MEAEQRQTERRCQTTEERRTPQGTKTITKGCRTPEQKTESCQSEVLVEAEIVVQQYNIILLDRYCIYLDYLSRS